MEIVAYGVSFILGIVIFGFINSIFDIYYFGFKGMAATFGGCWTAGFAIVYIFGAIAKWLIIIFVILWILSKLGKSAESK